VVWYERDAYDQGRTDKKHSSGNEEVQEDRCTGIRVSLLDEGGSLLPMKQEETIRR
jgi:hypothetical protein